MARAVKTLIEIAIAETRVERRVIVFVDGRGEVIVTLMILSEAKNDWNGEGGIFIKFLIHMAWQDISPKLILV